MTRVLHVITSLGIGGAERQLSLLLREAAQADGDVTHLGVVSLRAGGAVAEQLRAAGVRVWSLDVRGPLSLFRAPLRLRRLIRSERPTVLCAWLYHAMLVSAFAGVRRHGAALVWTVRGTWPPPAEKRATRLAAWLAGVCSGRADAILYNSERARDEHRAAGYVARDAVVHNGIALPGPDEARQPRDAAQLLFVGRYHPMKGVEVLLDALQLAAAQDPRARLVLVGPGCTDDNAALQAAVAARGLGRLVTAVGATDDLRPYYASADVLVSSSLWGEGFQNVLAEAAVRGCPVVATQVGEAALILGPAARLVEPGDAPGLAAALLELLALAPAARAAVGHQLRDHVRRQFAPSQMMAGFHHTFRVATSSRGQ